MKDDRDARIERIMKQYEAGKISYAVAQEAILFSDEDADDQRRKANGIA